MSHWTDEFKDFRLSEDGRGYSAIGEENNLLDIDAIDVIKIFDYIAGDENDGKNEIEQLIIKYCRIKGALDIWDTDAKKLMRVKENDIEYIKLPNIKLSFRYTVFEGETSFSHAQFEGEANFNSARFKGEITDFLSARFKFPAPFQSVKYWSDSVKTTWARKLWRNGKLLKHILPRNSPEGKPQEPAQFHIDSNNIDESSNATFKRYVADQQFMREFNQAHPFWYGVWRWSSESIEHRP